MIKSGKNKFIILFGNLLFFIKYKIKSLIAYSQHSKFSKCGKNVYIGHDCNFIHENIYCGHHVYIGERASFKASIANIYIGNYVMFGPNVTIRGGNHRIDIVGRYMYDIKEKDKLPENDQDVIIEDDVWVGCNVTILKGVTIGRGSVIAAGAIVIKSCKPYSIIGGNPAKLLKMRYAEETILVHEELLYGKSH